MKRQRIDLWDIATRNNLSLALWKAARAKRDRPEVQAFLNQADHHLNQLAESILSGQAPQGIYRSFQIHDPKQRLIHAACFEDRVLHHAIMNVAEPSFERALIPTCYACRPDKGVHRAIQQVQHNLQRYPWYVKTDIAGYFPHIDHDILFRLLCRRFKGNEFLQLLERIIHSSPLASGRGLPIGSLTSQHFANFYLDGADRFLLETLNVCAYVRYMDDMIFWCNSKAEAKATLSALESYLHEHRKLHLKPDSQINRSQHGVSYCGYRVKQGAILLSRRKQQRFQYLRQYWEKAWLAGDISSLQLQRIYPSIHAITLHADSAAWRKHNLRLHPPLAIEV